MLHKPPLGTQARCCRGRSYVSFHVTQNVRCFIGYIQLCAHSRRDTTHVSQVERKG